MPALFWWSAVAALLLVSGTIWMVWTAGRLDRMHLRCEAARWALDAALARRCALSIELAGGSIVDPASALLLLDAAMGARDADSGELRWQAESDLTAALHSIELPAAEGNPLVGELVEAVLRVSIARRIHNDVVATATMLRGRRRVRWFHLAGHAPAPRTISLDDRPLWGGRDPS
jgi:hypothetical protein